MRERTLVLLKPDAVERKLVGKIIQIFEEAGLEICAMQSQIAERSVLEKHYHKDEEWFFNVGQKALEFYQNNGLDPIEELETDNAVDIGKKIQSWLVDFMVSGPIVAMVLEGNDAVANVRRIVGSTIPAKADPGSIRGRFGIDSPDLASSEKRPILNLVHASGEISEAIMEIKLWFPELNPTAPKLLLQQPRKGLRPSIK